MNSNLHKNWELLPKEIQEKILCDSLNVTNANIVYKIIGNSIKHCKVFKVWKSLYKSEKDKNSSTRKVIDYMQINAIKNSKTQPFGWFIDKIANPTEAVKEYAILINYQ